MDSFEMPADEKRVVSNQNRTAVPKVQLHQPFRTLDNRSGGSLEPDLTTINMNGLKQISSTEIPDDQLALQQRQRIFEDVII